MTAKQQQQQQIKCLCKKGTLN